jgi:mRNA-degrading endonuclease RelE of RelBE toxin-antitoxin system
MYTSRRSDEQSSLEPEENNIKFHPWQPLNLMNLPNFMKLKELVWGGDIDAVEKNLALIRTNPFIGKIDKEGNRRFRVKNFPYLLIYKIKQQTIFVLAVAHTSRKPGYWKNRYF